MALTSIQGIQETLGMSGDSAKQRSVESRLDDAIADSFPASDPVSLAMPHNAKETGRSVPPSTTTMMLVGGGLLALIAVIALRR